MKTKFEEKTLPFTWSYLLSFLISHELRSIGCRRSSSAYNVQISMRASVLFFNLTDKQSGGRRRLGKHCPVWGEERASFVVHRPSANARTVLHLDPPASSELMERTKRALSAMECFLWEGHARLGKSTNDQRPNRFVLARRHDRALWLSFGNREPRVVVFFPLFCFFWSSTGPTESVHWQAFSNSLRQNASRISDAA